MVDFGNHQIMSRNVTVDDRFMKSYRIRHIYNRVESLEVGLSQEMMMEELEKAMVQTAAKYSERIVEATGSIMLMESGIRQFGSAMASVTTILHFEDRPSMELFLLKYPSKVFLHKEIMNVIRN